MVVAAGPVHVAVLEFFLRGLAHLGDLDFEVEVLACQRMVAVDGDHVALDAGDRHHARVTIGRLGLELHAGLQVRDFAERALRHALDEFRVTFAVTVGRRDLDAEFRSRRLALELAFEARNQVAVAVYVRERVAARGAVKHFALVVGEGVMDQHDFVRSNDHEATPELGRGKGKGGRIGRRRRRTDSDGQPVLELEPTARDAINDPDADDENADRERDEADQHEEQGQRQQEHDRDPERGEPERAQLPGEVRFQVGATGIAAADVVHHHGDDRRQAEHESRGDERRAEHADQGARRVQRIHPVGIADERCIRDFQRRSR